MIWRVGMLACCIKHGPWTADEPINAIDLLYPDPEYGDILRVSAVERYDDDILVLVFDGLYPGGYTADRFRPLNDAEDDAELIARIKNCKPARIPVRA
ncbi:hypothetical protein M2336_001692 [Sphingobium sp. B1D7B]|uniref:hypothetical protein n=1 Tax=Sphingobium sp. B1D7B TaxID=2940578 RepID=UPI002224CB0E|nr:hypothetical protein [Sphingobium sp. B1D7B]MCW2405063.1 hypothetical protein [Sphingobium sp. B1D7B]